MKKKLNLCAETTSPFFTGINLTVVWYTHISQLSNSCLRQKHIKSEIGSNHTICQVHTGAYVSLLAPGKTDYTACHPGKTTTYTMKIKCTPAVRSKILSKLIFASCV